MSFGCCTTAVAFRCVYVGLNCVSVQYCFKKPFSCGRQKHCADSALECDVQQKDIYQPESGEMGLDAVRKILMKLQAYCFRSRPASVSGTKLWRAWNHLTPQQLSQTKPGIWTQGADSTSTCEVQQISGIKRNAEGVKLSSRDLNNKSSKRVACMRYLDTFGWVAE